MREEIEKLKQETKEEITKALKEVHAAGTEQIKQAAAAEAVKPLQEQIEALAAEMKREKDTAECARQIELERAISQAQNPLRQEIDTLQNQLAEAKKEIEEVKRNHDMQCDELSQHQQILLNMQDRALEETNQQFSKLKTAHNREIAGLRAQLSSFEKAMAHSTQQWNANFQFLGNENRKLGTEFTYMQSSLRAKTRQIAELQEQVRQLDQDLPILARSFVNIEQDNTYRDASLEDLENGLWKALAGMEELQEKGASALSELRKTNNDQWSAIHGQTDASLRLEKGVRDLKTQVNTDNDKRELETLRQENKRLAATLNDLQTRHDNTIAQERLQNQNLARENAKLRRELTDFKQKASSNMTNAASQTEADIVESVGLRSARRQNAKLRDQNRHLKNLARVGGYGRKGETHLKQLAEFHTGKERDFAAKHAAERTPEFSQTGVNDDDDDDDEEYFSAQEDI